MNLHNSKLVSKLLPFFVAFIVIMAVSVTWFVQKTSHEISVPFTSMINTAENLGSETAVLTEKADGTLELKTKDATYVSHVPPNSQMVDQLVATNNIKYTYSNNSKYGPWIIFGLLILFMVSAIVIQKRTQGGLGNKMKSNISKPAPLPSIKLEDVGGLQDEMKEEIVQTLSILKDPDRSARMGINPPKGILLYGPPGTGKTLLAQAIAHELNANFFSASGSAFNEMFIGVGASRVRSLFQSARKQQGPAVIFIDEVDALAGKGNPMAAKKEKRHLLSCLSSLTEAIPMMASCLSQLQTARICLMKLSCALAGSILHSRFLCQIQKGAEK